MYTKLLRFIKKWLFLAGFGVFGALWVSSTLHYGVSLLSSDNADEKTLKTLTDSVVKLEAYGGGGGTAFLVDDPNGHPKLISNWHVCRLAELLGLMKATLNTQEDLPVKILRTNRKTDLCELSAVPGRSIPLGRAPKKFDSVYVIGHPLLHPQTPSKGHVVGESWNIIGMPVPADGKCAAGTLPVDFEFTKVCLQEMKLIDTTLMIYPGSSGSPTVNKAGEVVGVMNSSDAEMHSGTMIPVSDLRAFLYGEGDEFRHSGKR